MPLPPVEKPCEASLPSGRLLICAALALIEVLVLVSRFATRTLAHEGQWWSTLVLASGSLLPFLLASGATLVVLCGRTLLADLRQRSADVLRHPRSSAWLVANILAWSAFYLLSRLVFEGSVQASGVPGLWVSLWIASGGLTAATLFLAAIPRKVLQSLVIRRRGSLCAALLIGLGATLIGGATARLWDPLNSWTVAVARQQLSLIFDDVFSLPDERILGTPEFHIRIDYQCSGYEGIGLIWVFLAAYLWLFRRDLRFPRALLLLPIGTALMWFANTLRITALITLGHMAPDVALGGFHSYAGWAFFCVVALGIVAAAGRIHWFASAAEAASRAERRTLAYLGPFLAIVALDFLGGMFQLDRDMLYPLQVLLPGAMLLYWRRELPLRPFCWSWTVLGIGGVAFLLWLGLDVLAPPPSRSGWPASVAELPTTLWVGWILFRAAGVVVTVPLAEELAFRSYLTRRLQSADFEEVPADRFAWMPFLVTSIAYGLLHARWLAGILVGMLFALALYRRGRVLDAVLAHATTNFLLLCYVFVIDDWSIWS